MTREALEDWSGSLFSYLTVRPNRRALVNSSAMPVPIFGHYGRLSREEMIDSIGWGAGWVS
jgi:hypothetical protein